MQARVLVGYFLLLAVNIGSCFETVDDGCASADSAVCPGRDAFLKIFDRSAAKALNSSCSVESSTDTVIHTSCNDILLLCQDVIVALNLSMAECLENNSNSSSGDNTSVETWQAYVYGLIMVTVVSLLSLLGVVIVPCIHNERGNRYILLLLISMGVSALMCDAMFELLPTVFHSDSGKHDLWMGCGVLFGILLFYIMEQLLHLIVYKAQEGRRNQDEAPLLARSLEHSSIQVHLPRSLVSTVQPRKIFSFKEVRPLAWLILLGDLLHNMADGITLGATVAQSISLGLSTTFAVVLHEIPHELADFGILIKCGIHWIPALLFNFLSSLSAIIGFFVGVAISTNSTMAKEWLLAIATGSFLYIALADLLPELQNTGGHNHHGNNQNRQRMSFGEVACHCVLIGIGFSISFILLLTVSVNEDLIDKLFQ